VTRNIFQLAVIAALSVFPAPALAQYQNGWQRMPMHHWGIGWLWMLMGVIFWILIILALVYLIKYLVQAARRDQDTTKQGSHTPLEILKERYARGEIDREEFQSRKKDLLE
jgi:putative membrane protein